MIGSRNPHIFPNLIPDGENLKQNDVHVNASIIQGLEPKLSTALILPLQPKLSIMDPITHKSKLEFKSSTCTTTLPYKAGRKYSG